MKITYKRETKGNGEQQYRATIESEYGEILSAKGPTKAEALSRLNFKMTQRKTK